MKKVFTLLLFMVFIFSLTTAAFAGISLSPGGNMVMFLSDDYSSQEEDYYGFDPMVNHINVFLKASKSFSSFLSAGATMRLSTGFYQGGNANINANANGNNTYETDPWVKWSYDKLDVIVGTLQGDRVGYSNDLDLWGDMYAANNDNPGIKVIYKSSDKLTYTGVINSSVLTENGKKRPEYHFLGKMVYASDKFQLGLGYQTGSDNVTEDTGGWDINTAVKLSDTLKWDAEYEYRNSQIGASGSDYNNTEDTAALLTNLAFEGEKAAWTLRYYQTSNPGFRAIASDYYDPNDTDTYLIDLDPDYKVYDYVRRYGIDATIAGMEYNFKLNDMFSINGFVYRDIDFGASSPYGGEVRAILGPTGITNYKVGLTQQINDKLDIWYGYKEWYAYEYCAKLTYNWGKGLIGNIELGYGTTLKDVQTDEEAGMIAVAKLQCTF